MLIFSVKKDKRSIITPNLVSRQLIKFLINLMFFFYLLDAIAGFISSTIREIIKYLKDINYKKQILDILEKPIEYNKHNKT